MSCKCFSADIPSAKKSFCEKVELSKCKCRARLTVCENKRKFQIDSDINLSQIDKIKVDGFLETSSLESKCDYLFIYRYNKKEDVYIFVELKGTDIKHAIKQIGCSINMFYSNGFLKNKKVRGAIVFSTYPKNDGTYRKARLTLEKELSGKIKDFELEQKSKTMTYNPISDTFC
ncbi:hypothetical protein Barb6_00525 [Bacteroidales bacterium Barb6]|nr:hypothetical protein Barb6_00525 [Bacteroidales bacterium Barb6]